MNLYNIAMPELPEVETVKNGLKNLVIGKQIIAVWHDWPKSFPNTQNDVDAFLVGSKIVDVRRRAKVLMIDLDSRYSLVIHLKMTGQLVFVANDDSKRFGAGHPSGSLIGKLPDRSTRVIFNFVDSKLFFNDQRKFGWVRLLPTAEINNMDFFKKVGPEPLDKAFTEVDFAERFARKKKTTIKAAILDQSVIAGIGNIYADESLFAAEIHPQTTVTDVSEKQFDVLFRELVKVLQKSIEAGGSSDKNYVNAEGKTGSYLTFAKVFRREGQTCPRCGTIIEKIRVAGRGTHICPSCQKLAK